MESLLQSSKALRIGNALFIASYLILAKSSFEKLLPSLTIMLVTFSSLFSICASTSDNYYKDINTIFLYLSIKFYKNIYFCQNSIISYYYYRLLLSLPLLALSLFFPIFASLKREFTCFLVFLRYLSIKFNHKGVGCQALPDC